MISFTCSSLYTSSCGSHVSNVIIALPESLPHLFLIGSKSVIWFALKLNVSLNCFSLAPLVSTIPLDLVGSLLACLLFLWFTVGLLCLLVLILNGSSLLL